MDERKAEFLARLRETFRVEAEEHLEAITAGLLAMERVREGEGAALVERVFREAHSLKGAARSVSLPVVEAYCLELENIFAAAKREEMELTPGILDAIHPALAVLGTICSNPGEPRSREGEEEDRRVLAALKGVIPSRPNVSDRAEERRFAPRASAPKAPSESSEAPMVAAPWTVASIHDAAPDPASTPVSPPASTSPPAPSPSPRDTVRVSTQKISAVLLEAEELIGAKLAASTRAAELRALTGELASWNQQRLRQRVGRGRSQECSEVASDLLESEMLFTRKLESSLRRLAGAAHLDGISLAATSDRLLDDTKQVLLLPCSYLLGSLPKIVRELAREQKKEAELSVMGEDIEIDRRVLDELKDPLIHLLRNCVDHGIEKPDVRVAMGKPDYGTVTIEVKQAEGSRVELTVADDGSGIDTDKIRKAAARMGLKSPEEGVPLTEAEVTGLIFQSGLSTSPIITDLSGRGLGLTIVREKVEKLGGSITVTSTPDAGTAFRMLVPLSLAAFRGVLVEVAGRPFVIPSTSVVRVTRIRPEEIGTVENRPTINVKGEALSLVRLRDVLELSGPEAKTNGAARPVVVLGSTNRRVAFLVDEVLGEQEVLVKKLGPQLVRVRNVAGASISGSGSIIPILDVPDLVRSAGTVSGPLITDVHVEGSEKGKRRILIAEDSITARTLVKSILEGAGYEVVASVDGMDALTRLKTEPFDLVVSDVDMPRMNGFELTSRIRADKKLGELPVVLVTALGEQKDREYGIEVGANAYLVKSDFDQSNLIEIIRRLL